MITDVAAVAALRPTPPVDHYEIALPPGINEHAYARALSAPWPDVSITVTADGRRSVIARMWIPLAVALTLGLSVVASLGVSRPCCSPPVNVRTTWPGAPAWGCRLARPWPPR